MASRKIPPIIWFIIAVPFVYLASIYGELPTKIPIHYDGRGVADRWGHKATLWLLPIACPLLTAFIMTQLMPLVDRNGQLAKMGKKFESMSIGIVGAMSALATYFIANAGQETLGNRGVLLVLLGSILIAIGNYMPALRPNYLMGFRLPWTLNNEDIWRRTHRLAGRLWVGSGAVSILLALLVPFQLSGILFAVTVVISCLVPMVYSYWLYKNTKPEEMI